MSDLDKMRRRCRECGEPFLLTKGERLFYHANNLEEPTRCPACRDSRRARRQRAKARREARRPSPHDEMAQE